MNDEFYIIEKDYDGKNWAEYVLENADKNFKVAMKNKDVEIRHFSLKTSRMHLENYIIATFSDITQEIEQIKNPSPRSTITTRPPKLQSSQNRARPRHDAYTVSYSCTIEPKIGAAVRQTDRDDAQLWCVSD